MSESGDGSAGKDGGPYAWPGLAGVMESHIRAWQASLSHLSGGMAGVEEQNLAALRGVRDALAEAQRLLAGLAEKMPGLPPVVWPSAAPGVTEDRIRGLERRVAELERRAATGNGPEGGGGSAKRAT